MSRGGRGLCVLATVTPGEQSALEAEIERLPRGAASPFERLGLTHFARFAIVPFLKDRRGDQRSAVSYLLFSSEFDGPLAEYVSLLAEEIGDDLRPIFRHCLDFPADADAAGLGRFLLDGRVKPGYSVLGYPDTTVEQVRRALALRARLIDFVREHRADSSELQRDWIAEFGA